MSRDLLSRKIIFYSRLFILLISLGALFIGADFALAASITHGPVIGATTSSSAKIWARTDSRADLSVEYKLSAGSYPGTTTTPTTLSSTSDYTGVTEITGLSANTAYDFRLLLDGVAQSNNGSFTTFPAENEPGIFTFAFGGDTNSSSQPFQVFDLISARSPDFMIFAGDMINGDSGTTQSGYETQYKTDFWNESKLANFATSHPMFLTWGNHELYDVDNVGLKTQYYQIARNAYDEYISNFQPDPLLSGEIYNTFKIGDIDFFSLDPHTHASQRSALEGDNTTMLGSAQKEHLKAWLKNSTSTFKFVFSHYPWTPNANDGHNADWDSYSTERSEIYDWINDNAIKRVIFLSGHQHAGAVYKNTYSTTTNIYEFSVGPLDSDINSIASGDGALCSVNSKNQYSIISVNSSSTPATVNINIYDVATDTSQCNITVSANDINPPQASISSAADQTFTKGDGTTAISTITITDAATSTITFLNDIRIKIPNNLKMEWDATDISVTIGGGASAKASSTVSYEDSNKTLVIDVTSDFSGGDVITISDLSFKNFTEITGQERLFLELNNDGETSNRDDKTIQINGSASGSNKYWIGNGDNKLWSNASNWSGGAVPVAGNNVVFNATSTKNVIVDSINNNLGSITLESDYTGTIRFPNWVVNSTSSNLVLTGDLTVNNGTIIFEGDTNSSTTNGLGWEITANNLTIGVSGSIHSDGEGFEQGIGPGMTLGDTSSGPGGSHGGLGGAMANFSIRPVSANIYGNSSSPNSLGSGGGYSPGPLFGSGGSGGGAIKFNVSGTSIIDGNLSANGDQATERFGSGSGGSIWINGGILSGSGTIFAAGGQAPTGVSGGNTGGGAGGGGRIDISNTTNNFAGSFSVLGGSRGDDGHSGYAGTIVFPSAQLSNFTLSNSLTLGNDISYTFGNLTVATSGSLILDSNPDLGTGGTITADNITINSGGSISASERGYACNDPNAIGRGQINSRSSGGGYGGRGGDSNPIYNTTGGITYGTSTSPVALGSGGGCNPASNNFGGSGGGALKLNVNNNIENNGTISVDGEMSSHANGGGGSGGSIWINGGVLSGSGMISVDGGDAFIGEASGAGGGGRIDISNTTNNFTGTISVLGGVEGISGSRGYAGTIVFPSAQLSNFTLSNSLTLGNDISYTFGNLTVATSGSLILDSDPKDNSEFGSGGIINATNISIQSGGLISANAMGHNGITGPVTGRGTNNNTSRYGGGGYGGAGGDSNPIYGGTGGVSYGSTTTPLFLGNGFRNSATFPSNVSVSNYGGGAIYLNVSNSLDIEGTLSSNGEQSTAGGSVYVSVTGDLSGSGTISATGGSGTMNENGAGGGGRIALYYNTKSFDGTITVAGGAGGYEAGSDGSLYEEVLNTEPSVTLDDDFSSWQGGNITINYKLIDDDGDTLNISHGANTGIEYSTNTIDWFDATDAGGVSQGLTGLSSTSTPGASHNFIWDSLTDLSAIEDSSVYIRIRPNDGTANALSWATSTSFGVDNISPSSVGAPTFGTITDSSITINKPTTATENGSGLYQWQVRRNGTTGLGFIATSTTSTTDSSLTENTQYTYDIQFKDNANNSSDYGTTASIYTAVALPTNFTAAKSSENVVNFSVDTFTNYTTGLSGYYFYRNKDTTRNSGWIKTNSWQDFGFDCNTYYNWSIKYRNAEGLETNILSITGSEMPRICSQSSTGILSGTIQISPVIPNAPTSTLDFSTTTLISSSDKEDSSFQEELEENISLNSTYQEEEKTSQKQKENITNTTPFSVIQTPQYQFTQKIKREDKGEEVQKLQEFLSQDKEIYPEKLITGYFGFLTQRAVERFQCKYNIICQGSPDSTGYGVVGPKTREKINEIISGAANKQPPLFSDNQDQKKFLEEKIKSLQNQLLEILIGLREMLEKE